jgi:hypothetical protein
VYEKRWTRPERRWNRNREVKKKVVEESRERKGEVYKRQHAAAREVAIAKDREELITVQRRSRISGGRGRRTQ